jgi:hypothetical protein
MAEKHIRPVVEEISPEPPQPQPITEPSPAPVTHKELEPQPTENLEQKAQEVINSPPPKKKHLNFKLVILITLLTAIVVGVVAGAVYVFLSKPNSESNAMQGSDSTLESPEPSITPEPSPTPTPVDIATYKINILNGSGKIGEASKVGDLLEEDGFSIDSTGNASRYDYQETIIQTKEEISEEITSSISSLLTNAGYTPEFGDVLDEDEDYDIIITVGQSD